MPLSATIQVDATALVAAANCLRDRAAAIRCRIPNATENDAAQLRACARGVELQAQELELALRKGVIEVHP